MRLDVEVERTKERFMIRMKLLIPLAALVLAPAAFAGSYSLNDWCFYVNSLDLNHSCAEAGGGGTLDAPFQSASFNPAAGGSGILGSVSVTLTPGTPTATRSSSARRWWIRRWAA
jgi:hypothetical protein